MERAGKELTAWAREFDASGEHPRAWPAPIERRDTDAFLHKLLDAAALALRDEDQRLFQAFKQRNPARLDDPHRDHAKGLAYPVFEHNLVFPVFRAWLALDADVRWDESHTGGGRALIDLQVAMGDHMLVFESKWWPGGKSTTGVRADVQRLRNIASPNVRGFLMTYWYGTERTLLWDFSPASIQLKFAKPIHCAMFGANVAWNGQPSTEGYFTMLTYEVAAVD